jgi:chitinase
MGNMYQLKKLKERFPNLSVIASIGGYDFSNAFHDYIESPSLRSQLVASCVDLLKAYPDIFDGFDIDLEYPCISTDIPCGDNITPTSDDKGNFAALIQEFRLQMGPSPILSIATSADLTKIQALDFEKLDPVLDFYNIMTYDFTGGEYAVLYTGHHTQLRYNPSDPVDYRHTLSAENATNLFVANGASPSKINIGVAFYGRGFSIDYINQTNPFADSLGATTEGTWQAGVFDYADIMNNYITDNNSYYDNVSDSSFILDNEKGLFITYDSIRSVMAKTQFVRDNGFYGVFGWQVSQDSEDFQLLQAMGD